MTQWTTHAQFDSDPRRNGKLRVLRRETAEGESHMIASNVKPDIAPLIAAAPDLLAALEALLEGTCEALSFLDNDTIKHLKSLINDAETAITKAKGQ